MHVVLIILAMAAALKAHEQQPQVTFVPADEPLMEAVLEEST